MSTAMPNELPRRPITVEEYVRMREEGLIAHDAHVELIEGEIIEKEPLGPPHATIVVRLNRGFILALDDRAELRPALPLPVSNISMPEPDFAVVRPGNSPFEKHPAVDETLLVMEVSDTSLSFDLGRKLRMYARSGVLEVWVLDVNGRKLHRFRKPEGERYTEPAVIESPGVTPIGALPGVSIDLTKLFD